MDAEVMDAEVMDPEVMDPEVMDADAHDRYGVEELNRRIRRWICRWDRNG